MLKFLKLSQCWLKHHISFDTSNAAAQESVGSLSYVVRRILPAMVRLTSGGPPSKNRIAYTDVEEPDDYSGDMRLRLIPPLAAHGACVTRPILESRHISRYL